MKYICKDRNNTTEWVHNPCCSDDAVMYSYLDSPAYRDHPLFKSNPTALQIPVYYDDVEVVNPLGSNTKVHKLGKF